MSYDFTALCFVRFISGIIAIILVVLLWERRHAQGAIYLILFELTAAIWAISDGFEAASANIPQKLLWAQIAYIGVSTSAVMFLLFALSYTNHNRLVNIKISLILLVIPLITIIMAFTNSSHELLWSKIIILKGTNQSVYYYGHWFWVHVTYEYSVLIVGIIVLLIGAFRVYSLYKVQVWILIIATMLPFFVSILYVFKLTPVKGLDPTPISFIFSGVIVAISLFWLRMFNVAPLDRKQAFDNLRYGMFVVDSANRVVDANQIFGGLIGMQVSQMIGYQADIIFSKIKIDKEHFSSENDFTLETQIGVDENFQYFEVKCHLVIDKNQKLIGRVFLITNITTKKMILEALADSNYRLKTKILENEKLILDLDAYARSVAHELKNPISSVVSLSELIKISLSENKKDEAIEIAGMVKEQTEKIVKIIDDLLILSKIRKEEIKITSIDIKRILNEVLKRLHSEIIMRKAILRMPDHWPKVLGHNQWIAEVWMNLITNALKYGGIPPEINFGFEMETESIYRLWIQDNGNGLPSESLAKIFDDFERLGRKDIQGHGLGLPIVKRIVEKLGGEVNVESSNKTGEGCKFSFTLKGENQSQS
jgi:signal transduction histidine kinase